MMASLTANRKHSLIVCCCIVFTCNLSLGQSTKTQPETKSHLTLDLNQLSDYVFMGRKDSVAYPYFTPTLSYTTTAGFYASLGAFILTNQSLRLDGFTAQLGYTYTINDAFSGNLYGERYFYNTNSTNVKSETKGSIGHALDYAGKYFNVSWNLDVLLAKKADLTSTVYINKDFYLTKNGQFSISPGISFQAGTQRFYGNLKNNARRNPLLAQLTVNGANEFKLLNVEFSMPFNYESGRLRAYCIPYFTSPQNPITISNRNGVILRREQLNATFYWEAGISIQLF